MQEDDYPEFLNGDERENTQHITVTYLTDEKKKGSKSKKNESDEKQHGDAHTENTLSSKPKLSDSSKSVKSRFGLLSARSTQSKTNDTVESPTESQVGSSSGQAAANALSVTARWGFRHQFVDLSVADKLTTNEKELKNHGNKDKNKSHDDKLGTSLDANALSDALVCPKGTETECKGSTPTPLTAAASNQDLSRTLPDMPAYDVQSNLCSRRSSLKLVTFNLFSVQLFSDVCK